MPYEVAPIFLIRMAGAPFDVVEQLETPGAASLARELLTRVAELEIAEAEVHRFFASRERLLSPQAYHALRLAVRDHRPPAQVEGEQPAVFTNYAGAAAAAAALQSKLQDTLERELTRARGALIESSRQLLPNYLLFGSKSARDLLGNELGGYPVDPQNIPARNNAARKIEQTLLLYLQRVATKNDTFSEFGPSSWGEARSDVAGLELKPSVGVSRRDAFMERWTAHALAAVINSDAANSNPKLLVPALEPYATNVLCHDVEKWPAGPAREKWLPVLKKMVDLPQQFIETTKIDQRQSILDRARLALEQVDATIKSTDRFLYAATNPIAEECFRETHFAINESILSEVARDAAPWVDLWRDSYAFIACRVAAGLRGIMERAGAKSGVMPLPGFLQACESANLSLTGPGLVAFAVMAFQEIKAAVRKRLQPHVEQAEYELTREDCDVVRQTFDYPKFDEYTYPSADLQIAAHRVDDVQRGDYRWLVSELHPPPALLHHGFYWACPNKPLLNEALACAAGNKPNFHFGFFAADFTAHTTVRIFDALPQLSNFVAPQRSNPNWRSISPQNAEVYVDEKTGDVCVRTIDSQEHLGSFARAWVIPLGFHPFQFSAGPRTPRLRCGKVIVQRRSWTLSAEEFPAGKYHGLSRNLVTAIEKIRTERGLPRHIYIRPTEQALRRSGAEGRDKDTKPIYIDLESYLFVEIFYRWLTKAGEIEITEMLPSPNDLLWREPNGRRTFELRTLIVPKK